MTFDTGEGPVLIPADPGLGAADNNLANVPREERYDRLADFIAEDLAATYDFVLVDLPGKEDNIAISGLYAVEDVIAPLRPARLSVTSLRISRLICRRSVTPTRSIRGSRWCCRR